MLTEKEAITESIKIWKELYETGAEDKPDWTDEYYNACPLCQVALNRGYDNENLDCDFCSIDWPITILTHDKSYNPCCNSYFHQWNIANNKKDRRIYANLIVKLLENKLKELEGAEKVNIEITDLNVINNMIYDERFQEEGNYVKILREIRDNFGDLVISENKNIQRLVGFHDDGDDYYYIMKSKHGEISYESCVGRFIPIKGRIPTTDYEYLNNCFLYTEKTYKRIRGINEK